MAAVSEAIAREYALSYEALDRAAAEGSAALDEARAAQRDRQQRWSAWTLPCLEIQRGPGGRKA